MKIINHTRKTIIAEDVKLADTFITRMIGLLGKQSMSPKEGLIITQCHSIHMFFMRFAIDAIFVSRNHQVVGLSKNIKPWQLSPCFFKSSYVIELYPGVIERSSTSIGDTFIVEGWGA